MTLVFASPLYPPDLAEPAPYTKELARRLSTTHTVIVVAYGRLPEKVPGAQIIAVNKRRPLPWRLAVFTKTLWQVTRNADVLYVQNGASVELPALITTFFLRKPLIVHMGDDRAHERAKRSLLHGFLERAVLRRAYAVVRESPLERPEILPLHNKPEAEIRAWEESWTRHCSKLEDIFESARKKHG